MEKPQQLGKYRPVQPLRVIETPEDGVCAYIAHLLTTRTDPGAP
jgi:hypothetical protein